MKRRALKELAIAKRAHPPARPAKQQQPALFARMKGTIKIFGDIVSSTGERWHADE
jgi:hypothetical protein